ncbi:MAG: hypothetical protein HN348_16665, partial [Proteobacteria bacterium]|nr:hypothetical protein [Pseudomonadota bacterium]
MKKIIFLALMLSGCKEVEEGYNFAYVSPDIGPGAATEAYDDTQARVRKEVFWYGGRETTPVSDYLFVIDNSVSMIEVLDRFQKGFQQLADESPFPSKARIAIMNSTPAHLNNLKRPHPAVHYTRGLYLDPGFLRLVNQQGIETYRKVGREDLAENFKIDGCSNAWFTPGEKNATGVP